jgi:hypothetical protein
MYVSFGGGFLSCPARILLSGSGALAGWEAIHFHSTCVTATRVATSYLPPECKKQVLVKGQILTNSSERAMLVIPRQTTVGYLARSSEGVQTLFKF